MGVSRERWAGWKAQTRPINFCGPKMPLHSPAFCFLVGPPREGALLGAGSLQLPPVSSVRLKEPLKGCGMVQQWNLPGSSHCSFPHGAWRLWRQNNLDQPVICSLGSCTAAQSQTQKEHSLRHSCLCYLIMLANYVSEFLVAEKHMISCSFVRACVCARVCNVLLDMNKWCGLLGDRQGSGQGRCGDAGGTRGNKDRRCWQELTVPSVLVTSGGLFSSCCCFSVPRCAC